MFEIIQFTASNEWYYPKSVGLGFRAAPATYKDHTQVKIPIGASRIGGPIVDFPTGEPLPKDLHFVASLDLTLFSKHDPFKLLPTTGYLFFFLGGYGNEGLTIYFDVESTDLERHVIEHDSWFWEGCLIEQIMKSTESMASRYREEDGIVEWDYFAGSDVSKIYGIYTHCQKAEDEILEITSSNEILLLQVGENFTDEGVWSVLIDKQHLKDEEFSKCTFEWGQS